MPNPLNPVPSQETLSTGQLAKLVNHSSQTVINWLERYETPFIRYGRGPRKVLKKDFVELLKKMNAPIPEELK